MKIRFDANDSERLMETLFGRPEPDPEPKQVFSIEQYDKNDPTERDFIVTATIQVIVRGADRTDARLTVMDDLQQYIGLGPYVSDPMNGVIIDDIEDITVDPPAHEDEIL